MRRVLNPVRGAPTWSVAVALAIAVVAFNLAMPEDPSTGGMAAAIVVFLALLALLVATRGREAWILLGLLILSGWLIRAVDFPGAAEMVVFVLAFTVVGHALGLPVGRGRRDAESGRPRIGNP